MKIIMCAHVAVVSMYKNTQFWKQLNCFTVKVMKSLSVFTFKSDTDNSSNK